MQTMTGALQDLNDLYFFAAVVENGGFSAAGRALGIPKSRLSKRVAQLEERLGVRLLQRTTRKFVVTETGERFYEHCRAVLEEARAAQDAVDAVRAEPRGMVRISCPVSLARSLLAPILPDFLAEHPKVQVRLLASNRRVDLIDEGYDIAIRVRFKLDTDATLIVREFGMSSMILVAGSALWEQFERPQTPADLSALPTLSMNEQGGAQTWELMHTNGDKAHVDVTPRLVSGEFAVLLEAAQRGMGVALLPESVCARFLEEGRLERLLPDWSGPQGTMHFVYPSRRGLLPAVRALVDFLAERLPPSAARTADTC
ncbi:MAG TPA: LysR substrate-binding domain-containing protein [Oleiagrimonas sp.]|nr:LysR substrate-binding domain-containing protein [Oleiagrimonas sp.]